MPIDMKYLLSTAVSKETALSWLEEEYRLAMSIGDFEEAAKFAYVIMAVNRIGKE